MKKKVINNNVRVFKFLSKMLNVSKSKINIKTSVTNLREYDSLAILNIATFFEKKVKNKKIKFDVKDFSSVKKIINLVKKYNIQI